MAEGTERTSVRTYVPAYQKEEWRAHAEVLDMSQSEFVRTMVQAGRRGFEAENPDEPDSPDASPGVDDLETEVIDLLRENARTWEELREATVGDMEARLEETLENLQENNRVKHSGRSGGYVIDE
jgi:hypothetical protein